MKAKTIRLTLRRKVDEWIASVDDEDLRAALRRDVVVTGGCITSMLLREKVSDYDVYLRTRETAERVAGYYVERFKDNPPTTFKDKPRDQIPVYVETRGNRVRIVVKSAGVASEAGADDYEYFEQYDGDEAAQYVGEVMQDPAEIADAHEEAEGTALEQEGDRPKYRPVFLSSNAVTLSDRVQVILRFWGEPAGIHANYDFVHCTCWWTSHDNHLELPRAALEAILTKELRYVGSLYPICSLIRVRKFTARGWTINAGQVLKMCMQVGELNLRSVDVLEDQLTGVDVAYFHEVIDRLRKRDQRVVDTTYLLEIVDRMF